MEVQGSRPAILEHPHPKRTARTYSLTLAITGWMGRKELLLVSIVLLGNTSVEMLLGTYIRGNLFPLTSASFRGPLSRGIAQCVMLVVTVNIYAHRSFAFRRRQTAQMTEETTIGQDL
jgi:hypothetical protein